MGRPTYKALFKVDPELARKTFKQNQNFYHPICRAMCVSRAFPSAFDLDTERERHQGGEGLGPGRLMTRLSDGMLMQMKAASFAIGHQSAASQMRTDHCQKTLFNQARNEVQLRAIRAC